LKFYAKRYDFLMMGFLVSFVFFYFQVQFFD